MIIRLCIPSQLTFLLRTCPPHFTLSSASKLDDAIFHLIFKITDSNKYISKMNEDEQFNMIARYSFKIKLGGLGIISSIRSRNAAYIGSIALCTHWCSKIIPNLESLIINNNYMIPTYMSYQTSIDNIHYGLTDPKIIERISLKSIFERQELKIQNILSDLIHESTEKLLDKLLPQGGSASGISLRYQGLSIEEKEYIIQHMVNKNKVNYAFLMANPAVILNRMSNQAFATAIQCQLLLPICDSRLYCLCGDKSGRFLQHANACGCAKVRNRIRNSYHMNMKIATINIIKQIIINSPSITIDETEPLLSKYFIGINNDIDNHNENNNIDNNSSKKIYSNTPIKGKVYSDFIIKNNENNINYIVDVTSSEPTAQSLGLYINVGHAAKLGEERKIKEYKNWDIKSNKNNCLIPICYETYGIIGDDSIKFIQNFIDKEKNIGIFTQYLYQHLSAAMHTARAISINKTKFIIRFNTRIN